MQCAKESTKRRSTPQHSPTEVSVICSARTGKITHVTGGWTALTQFAAHATTDMKNAGGFVAPAGEGVFTEWYDDETASKVQQRYHADFRAFNYSKDWRRMWE